MMIEHGVLQEEQIVLWPQNAQVGRETMRGDKRESGTDAGGKTGKIG